MSHPDIMCEVEVDSNIVEVVDSENFNDIGGVTYGHYDVGVGDDQYEEVTCETEDSQGMMMQTIEDGKHFAHRAQTHKRNSYSPNCVLPLMIKIDKTYFVRFADDVILQSDPDLQGHEEVLDVTGDPMCYGDVSSLGNEIYIESAPGPSR